MAVQEGTCDETPFEGLCFPLSIRNWPKIVPDFRPYFVAKSQTKMVRSMKFARIPPGGWQGITPKTADKYDKAAPTPDAPAGWRSRMRCETAWICSHDTGHMWEATSPYVSHSL